MQSKRIQSIVLRIIFGVLLSIVTHQSLVPVPASVFTHWSDKVLHVGAWLVVAIAMGFAFPRIHPLWTLFLLLFGYSVAIECGQILVPGRMFTLEDIVANGVGCGVGFLMTRVWQRRVTQA